LSFNTSGSEKDLGYETDPANGVGLDKRRHAWRSTAASNAKGRWCISSPLADIDELSPFMAVKFDVIELDGRSFSSASEAREAVRDHVTQRVDLAA